MENEMINPNKQKNKKITLSSEAVYAVGIILLSLAVAILTSADFGVSQVVAPAYLLSLKLDFLTFGQAEYIVQAGVFLLLCVVLKRFKIVYLQSFVTCLIYGAVLDLWRKLPCFDPSVTPPGSMALWLRIVMFVFGALLTSFSVALFFKTYLYPQVYDMFVKAVSVKYNIKLSVFKTIVDVTMFISSIIMTYCFFGKIIGIGFGTLIMAFINGFIIGLFSKLLDRHFDFKPTFENFAKHFEM